MAGDWIKMRSDLPEDPAVYKISTLTSLDRLSVVGRLYAFWSWADKHAVDGYVDAATSEVVDDVVRHVGFAAAMESVGWLEIRERGVSLPNHDRHNGASAKERVLKNQRQARWRAKSDEPAPTRVDSKPSTTASTREEKRREDINSSKRARFSPPTHDEVQDYCLQRRNGIDPKRFIDFYESKGWKVGNAPMKDWQAAIRTWEQRDHGAPSGTQTFVARHTGAEWATE